MCSQFLIYALCGINEEVRYIGKSCSGMNRPKRHFHPNVFYKEKTTKARWIRNFFKKYGTLPTIKVIEETTKELLNEREVFWIKEFSKTGRLVNRTVGGDGFDSITAKKGWEKAYANGACSKGGKATAALGISKANGKARAQKIEGFLEEEGIYVLFDSACEASRLLSINRGNIAAQVNGARYKKLGGWKFSKV